MTNLYIGGGCTLENKILWGLAGYEQSNVLDINVLFQASCASKRLCVLVRVRLTISFWAVVPTLPLESYDGAWY